jgi:hypothetical protein
MSQQWEFRSRRIRRYERINWFVLATNEHYDHRGVKIRKRHTWNICIGLLHWSICFSLIIMIIIGQALGLNLFCLLLLLFTLGVHYYISTLDSNLDSCLASRTTFWACNDEVVVMAHTKTEIRYLTLSVVIILMKRDIFPLMFCYNLSYGSDSWYMIFYCLPWFGKLV